MTHALARILETKKTAIGTIVGLDSTLGAEALARAGYDYLFIDQQHCAIDDATMLPMVQATQGAGCIALVRPSWNAPAGIMRALDFGADGVIAPLIDTADQAAYLVTAMRYTPQGRRSWGPIRAGLPDGTAYGARANRMHAAIAMIETAPAYENLDAILATPGLDAILIGPNDLSFSLGCSGEPMFGDGAFAGVVRDIAARATAAGVLPGTHCGDPESAQALIAAGFRFVSIDSDLTMLYGAARATLAELSGAQG